MPDGVGLPRNGTALGRKQRGLGKKNLGNLAGTSNNHLAETHSQQEHSARTRCAPGKSLAGGDGMGAAARAHLLAANSSAGSDV